MKDCSNILVIIEPAQVRQPALMRAISLYNIAKNKNHEVKITAVLPIEKETFNIASVLAVDKKQYHEELVKKQTRWLKAYLSINAIDIKIDSKVIFSKTPGKDIAQIAKQIGASLLIKSNEIHSLLDSLFFTSLDTQMLRHAPIPVCIAKDILNTHKRPVAIAMDFSDPNDVLLNYTNLRLLREAQKYALLTDGEIYLINAIAPVVPPVAVDLPGFNPEQLCSQIACQSKYSMIEFAKRHKLKESNCLSKEGPLDEIILTLVNSINPSALFIGTSARKGISSYFIGNLCEDILDNAQCDVFVLTPKSVIRKIPTTAPSKCIC